MSRLAAAARRIAGIVALAAIGLAATPAHAAPDNDAAVVMDAQTGRLLYERRADELRAPASLTKVMTL